MNQVDPGISAARLADLESVSVMRNYLAWVMECAGPHLGPRVLEVGCGIGANLLMMEGREYVLGIDTDSAAVSRAIERIAGKAGIQAKEMDVLSPEFLSLGGSRISGVLFVNSLSLIRDYSSAIANVKKILVPGGKTVVWDAAVPAISGNDKLWGTKRFGLSELGELLTSNGFEVIRLCRLNFLGYLGWAWDSLLRRRHSMSKAEYARRDRFVPLARSIDGLTGPPLGRTLFAVAVKK